MDWFSTEPTLIKIGKPDHNSPVLLTCNFILTVKRVLKSIKELDYYLLISPSNGINAWCGACGDDFKTESVISIIKTSNINNLVDHRTLILPQLSAPGIDPVKIKKKTNWTALFGPVRAKDIPNFIKNQYKKTEEQRTIKFTIKNRFEIGNLYFFSLFSLTSIIYWITFLFLHFLTLNLYLDTILVLATLIYGALLVLPSVKLKRGLFKAWILESIFLMSNFLLFFFSVINFIYFFWNSIFSIILALILSEDFYELTPIYKSELGDKAWKKGKKTINFLFGKYKLQPYGEIYIDINKCIGCKICIDVCPRGLYVYKKELNKVSLQKKENCINCNACVKRCPARCLFIK